MGSDSGPLVTGNVMPLRAVVVPRARRLPGGDPLPIERLVRAMVARRQRGAVRLIGPAGSGKTSALQHLASVFTVPPPIHLVDDEPLPRVAELTVMSRQPVIFTSSTDPAYPLVETLEMEPWGDDDLIEYLLAVHPLRVGSVMERVVNDPDRASLRGSPLLWRIVLDTMAATERITTAATALRSYLATSLAQSGARRRVAAAAFRACMDQNWQIGLGLKTFGDEIHEMALHMLQHRVVQVLLGAEHVASTLAEQGKTAHFVRLPLDLLREAATVISSQTEAHDQLTRMLNRSGDPLVHPTVASLLLAIDPTWRPAGAHVRMTGAHLPAAKWAGISLPDAKLDLAHLARTDFSGANLTGASFREAMLAGANFRGATIINSHFDDADLSRAILADVAGGVASLRGTKLGRANLCGAKLRAASLCGADLQGATARNCDLTDATLTDTQLDEADFEGAKLAGARLVRVRLSAARWTGATFRGAELIHCNLEGMEVSQPDFQSATLRGSYLTGSVMPAANFRDAKLTDTGLAEIEWEGADLRGADFTGASFHMGSSRSGLVGSTIACEGSRTGFYTDDFNEQDYKSPEEIRKANLYGADLRGAQVAGVDFYLVDLRDAKYTPDQAEHFRRCGAILRSRVR